MVDAWCHIKINPYDNMMYQTPFKLRLGIVKLFKNNKPLEKLAKPLCMTRARGGDLEFHTAVLGE